MSSRVYGAAALASGVLLAAALLHLFGSRFEAGQPFPAYSSLRRDPAGTSVLFESFRSLVPATQRNFAPLSAAGIQRGATLLLLGVQPSAMAGRGPLSFQIVEQLALRGVRVVVALHHEAKLSDPANLLALHSWDIETSSSGSLKGRDQRWRSLDSRAGIAIALIRQAGNGSIVLQASSFPYSNRALAERPGTADLLTAIGQPSVLIFDENHLGIAESGSVMTLIYRYGLHGPLLGILVCVGLMLWRQSVSFPPPPNEPASSSLAGRTSQSALVSLLARNVASGDLAGLCWREWLKGNHRPLSADRRAAAEAVVAAHGDDPVRALRRIHEVLLS